MGFENSRWMQWLFSAISDTHTSAHWRSSQSKYTVTHFLMTAPPYVTSARTQIANLHKHYAILQPYVIRRHNTKLDRSTETLADEHIHMVQLIHLTWLASVKVQAVIVQLIRVSRILDLNVSLSSMKWETVLCCCFFKIQKVMRGKREDCAESLHCVTAGSRGKRERKETGGGEQGHSEGREGCVFTDLVRAMETPPPSPTPPHYWRVKGTFKQYQTDRNECREAWKRDSQVVRGRQAGGATWVQKN